MLIRNILCVQKFNTLKGFPFYFFNVEQHNGVYVNIPLNSYIIYDLIVSFAKTLCGQKAELSTRACIFFCINQETKKIRMVVGVILKPVYLL